MTKVTNMPPALPPLIEMPIDKDILKKYKFPSLDQEIVKWKKQEVE